MAVLFLLPSHLGAPGRKPGARPGWCSCAAGSVPTHWGLTQVTAIFRLSLPIWEVGGLESFYSNCL